MSFSELTLLDFKNILEWYDLLSDKVKGIGKYERSQEKIRGLFNIHEDRSEPLGDNLIANTLSELELHTSEELKSASSLLQNRKCRLEIKSEHIREEMIHQSRSINSEIDHLKYSLEEKQKDWEESNALLDHESEKIILALGRILKKLSGEQS
jgi:hypothetical protein